MEKALTHRNKGQAHWCLWAGLGAGGIPFFFFFNYGRQEANCEVGNGWREVKLKNVSEGCKMHQKGA